MISYFKLQGKQIKKKNPHHIRIYIYIMCVSEVDLDLAAAGEMLLVVHWSPTAVNPHWGKKMKTFIERKFSLTFSFHTSLTASLLSGPLPPAACVTL